MEAVSCFLEEAANHAAQPEFFNLFSPVIFASLRARRSYVSLDVC